MNRSTLTAPDGKLMIIAGRGGQGPGYWSGPRAGLRAYRQHLDAFPYILPAGTSSEGVAMEVHPAVMGREIVRFYAAAETGDDVCGHSLVVARYALLLAKALAVQEREFLQALELGALLHDIGKIGIPSRILMKRAPLSRFEKEVIQEHPLLGYELISEFEYLRGASAVVLYHHERYDGQGYPFGLAAGDIPLAARIFSVADTLDAMTSDRPYRRGRSFLETEKEIIRCRGTQFDPDIVEAFLSVPFGSWHSTRETAGLVLEPYQVH